MNFVYTCHFLCYYIKTYEGALSVVVFYRADDRRSIRCHIKGRRMWLQIQKKVEEEH